MSIFDNFTKHTILFYKKLHNLFTFHQIKKYPFLLKSKYGYFYFLYKDTSKSKSNLERRDTIIASWKKAKATKDEKKYVFEVPFIYFGTLFNELHLLSKGCNGARVRVRINAKI